LESIRINNDVPAFKKLRIEHIHESTCIKACKYFLKLKECHAKIINLVLQSKETLPLQFAEWLQLKFLPAS
jgi:hypothetical protein